MTDPIERRKYKPGDYVFGGGRAFKVDETGRLIEIRRRAA